LILGQNQQKEKPGWLARRFLRRVGCGYTPHGATDRPVLPTGQ